MGSLARKTALVTGASFLASGNARWITGQTISVDGGSKL